MKLYFICTFLSDVVLTSKAATEGFHDSLDYIPGSKFLGIVAKNIYDEDSSSSSLDLFHNGKVKFGNAYPSINDETSFPMPLAWFEDKLKTENKIYLHHFINDEIRGSHRKEGIQLKQRRENYITYSGGKEFRLIQDFSIKSAYDSDKRKSKDSQMYGYHAIPAGSKFAFEVEIQSQESLSSIIKDNLVGVKKIGRSKSAEYGLIEIEEYKPSSSLHQPIQNNQLIIYASSDLCFIDEYGFNTVEIKPEYFGMESQSAKIDWKYCQIKTRIFQSYNNHRRTSNADYLVIQKGSVIIINSDKLIDQLPDYVGVFQSEGFGKVLYNPAFLLSDDVTIRLPEKLSKQEFKNNRNIFSVIESGEEDKLILSMLQRRHELKKADQTIEKLVDDFVKQSQSAFKQISKSQWGAIRAIAKSTPKKDQLIEILFHQDKDDAKKNKGFLRRGIAAKNWDKLADTLEQFILKKNHAESVQEILIKTASKMQKLSK